MTYLALAIPAALAVALIPILLTWRKGKQLWLAWMGLIGWVALAVLVLVNAIWIPTFSEVGHLAKGCYLTDALWLYVACRGFPGAALASSVLSFPYLLHPLAGSLIPFITIPAWVILLYPIWYWAMSGPKGSSR